MGCRLIPALAAARASWGTTWSEATYGSLGEAGTMPSSCVSLRLLWKNFIVSSCLCARALGIWYIISVVLVSGSPCSGCLGVAYEYEYWILRETTFFVGAMLGTTVDTCSASALR